MPTAWLKYVPYAVVAVALVWWNPYYGMPWWLDWPLFVGLVYAAGECVDALIKAIRRRRAFSGRSAE